MRQDHLIMRNLSITLALLRLFLKRHPFAHLKILDSNACITGKIYSRHLFRNRGLHDSYDICAKNTTRAKEMV